MIDGYVFGKISINGEMYEHDLSVNQDGQVFEWKRIEAYSISVADIFGALEQKPEIIVIGTGYDGVARVDDELRDELDSKKIELVVKKTEEAIREFKFATFDKKRVIGFFCLS